MQHDPRALLGARGRRLDRRSGICFWGACRKDVAKEVRQEAIQASPGLFPQTPVSFSFVRRKQKPSVHHHQKNILQAFGNGFFLHARSEAGNMGSGAGGEGTHASSPTYQVISLSAVHQPVHDVKDLEPQVKHAFPLREQDQIVEEDLAEECRGLHPRLTHPDRIGLVHFGLE